MFQKNLTLMDDWGNNWQIYLEEFSSRPNPELGQFWKDLDVCTPGASIVGPYKRDFSTAVGYYYLWGTSMATPHVSAIAALVAEKYPSFNQFDMEWVLKKAAAMIPLASDGAIILDPWGIWDYKWNDHDYGSGWLQADNMHSSQPSSTQGASQKQLKHTPFQSKSKGKLQKPTPHFYESLIKCKISLHLNFFIFSVTAAANRKTKIKRANSAEGNSLITYSAVPPFFINYLKNKRHFSSFHKNHNIRTGNHLTNNQTLRRTTLNNLNKNFLTVSPNPLNVNRITSCRTLTHKSTNNHKI
jgi:hypothetical protein